MDSVITSSALRFIGLGLIQILILPYVDFNSYVNLYIYPLFILLIPVETPRWVTLLSAFFLGLLVGINYNQAGVHAATAVFIAFIRPSLLSLMEPRGGYNSKHIPSKYHFGFSWFFQYSSILFIIFFLMLFSLETLNFSLQTLLMTTFSYVFSIILVVLYMYLFNPKN